MSELIPTGKRKSKAIESSIKDQAGTSLANVIDGDPESFQPIYATGVSENILQMLNADPNFDPTGQKFPNG